MAVSPIMTANAAGNLLASASIAAGANATYNVDVSAKFANQIQHTVTFGTVATTAGLRVDVFRRIGTGPVVDTQAMLSHVITAVASTTKVRSLELPTGRYQVSLTNLDATNGVTAVSATGDTIDSVG
jgi:hypothetical protein